LIKFIPLFAMSVSVSTLRGSGWVSFQTDPLLRRVLTLPTRTPAFDHSRHRF